MRVFVIASMILCVQIFAAPKESPKIFAYAHADAIPRCLNLELHRQQSFPDPPNDLTRVYYLSGNKLLPLPFELGELSLNVFVPALNDRITRVKVKGAKSETVLTNHNTRFYVFVADKMDPPPHQLVRLANRRSNRELKISVIKGRKGYAPFDEDSVRLEHRLLERLRVTVGQGRIIFVNYMEMRPVGTLPPGEYAIIGDSLSDMATFRIE